MMKFYRPGAVASFYTSEDTRPLNVGDKLTVHGFMETPEIYTVKEIEWVIVGARHPVTMKVWLS